MDNGFENLVVEALSDEWERQRGDAVDSKDVYARLIEKGVDVPEGAMNEAFESLRADGLIRGPGYFDREGILLHGARYVTDFNPSILPHSP